MGGASTKVNVSAAQAPESAPSASASAPNSIPIKGHDAKKEEVDTTFGRLVMHKQAKELLGRSLISEAAAQYRADMQNGKMFLERLKRANGFRDDLLPLVLALERSSRDAQLIEKSTPLEDGVLPDNLCHLIRSSHDNALRLCRSLESQAERQRKPRSWVTGRTSLERWKRTDPDDATDTGGDVNKDYNEDDDDDDDGEQGDGGFSGFSRDIIGDLEAIASMDSKQVLRELRVTFVWVEEENKIDSGEGQLMNILTTMGLQRLVALVDVAEDAESTKQNADDELQQSMARVPPPPLRFGFHPAVRCGRLMRRAKETCNEPLVNKVLSKRKITSAQQRWFASAHFLYTRFARFRVLDPTLSSQEEFKTNAEATLLYLTSLSDEELVGKWGWDRAGVADGWQECVGQQRLDDLKAARLLPAEPSVPAPTKKEIVKQKRESEKIDAALLQERQLVLQRRSDVANVLLLGSSGAGKSTFFKQIQMWASSTLGDLGTFAQQMQTNFFDLLEALGCYQVEILLAGRRTTTLTKEQKRAAQKVHRRLTGVLLDGKRAQSEGKKYDEEMLRTALVLWQEPIIANDWNKFRTNYKPGLPSNCDFLVQNAERIMQPDYEPTEADLLHMRHTTRGVNVAELQIKNSKGRKVDLKVYDPQGERTARRKWLHYFEATDAILFITSLADFDEIVEDGKTLGLRESLDAFEMIFDQKSLVDKPIMVFLNKIDVFVQKIKVIALSDSFEDAPKGSDGENEKKALSWVESKFREVAIKWKAGKRVTFFTTSGTDQKLAQKALSGALKKTLNKVKR